MEALRFLFCRPRSSSRASDSLRPDCPPIARNMDPDLADLKRVLTGEDLRLILPLLNDLSPPAEPVDDYITEPDDRCALFSELQQLHQDLDVQVPNAATLGFFMVAPTDHIREYLALVRNTAPPYDAQLLKVINAQAPSAMIACMPGIALHPVQRT